MYIKKYVILLLVFVQITFAQEGPSIHRLDYEKNKSIHLAKTIDSESDSEIIPLNINVQKNLSKAVFGYYPDWEYLNNAHKNFNYNLLTHIAAFDFSVSANGQISEPSGWPWTSVINKAHENGVKMVMVIVNFDADDIHNLLTNSFARWGFMRVVQNKIRSYSLDGVNIDFEGLKVADRGSLINEFMQELTDSVHSINEELEVSFAAPAVNWGGWDLTGLANSCDYLFVMGYDFYGSWSTVTGPSAPLSSSSPYNVRNTTQIEYGTLSTFNPKKLILGVPYFGPHWTTNSSSEGASIIQYQNAVRFRSAQVESDNYGLNWSSTFQNSWYNYKEGSINHQVWFDNDSSLGLKFDLAIAKNLKGVGMWALGYDGTRTEYWDLIADKFSIPVSVEEEEQVPTSFSLAQNYPNPFNPTTTIKYTIPKTTNNFGTTKLKVYDLLGSEVATLVNEQNISGNYDVVFDATNLASGTYIYQLQHGSFRDTKKMILIK
jgi:spore germination protein YaaH